MGPVTRPLVSTVGSNARRELDSESLRSAAANRRDASVGPDLGPDAAPGSAGACLHVASRLLGRPAIPRLGPAIPRRGPFRWDTTESASEVHAHGSSAQGPVTTSPTVRYPMVVVDPGPGVPGDRHHLRV